MSLTYLKQTGRIISSKVFLTLGLDSDTALSSSGYSEGGKKKKKRCQNKALTLTLNGCYNRSFKGFPSLFARSSRGISKHISFFIDNPGSWGRDMFDILTSSISSIISFRQRGLNWVVSMEKNIPISQNLIYSALCRAVGLEGGM